MANKYNVTFVNKSDEVKKAIVGLSKTALRASGKVVRKYLRDNVPLRSKRFKNHIGTWVMINYSTGTADATSRLLFLAKGTQERKTTLTREPALGRVRRKAAYYAERR